MCILTHTHKHTHTQTLILYYNRFLYKTLQQNVVVVVIVVVVVVLEVAGLLYPYGPTNGDSEGPSLGEVTYLHVNKRFRAYGRRYKNLYVS